MVLIKEWLFVLTDLQMSLTQFESETIVSISEIL